MQALKILIVDADASMAHARRIDAGLARAWGQVELERVGDIGALHVALAKRSWDAILCDVSPPIDLGRAALAVARAIAPDLPVVAIAADLRELGEAGVREVLAAGADACVGHEDVAALALAIARSVREARLRSEVAAATTDEERFFELTLDMLAIVDFEGRRFRRVNPAWE